jgi:hypothetical protein
MSWRRWLVLVALGTVAAAGAGWWVRVPGYMDADYYDATARQLAEGAGFREPFLWNYLDDPQGLPHPSHLYWMPLTSVVASAGMVLFGAGFRAAQVPFLLLTALIPSLTAALCLRLSSEPRHAWLAGWLAAFSGFLFPFFATTDTFVVYAVLGALALWVMAEGCARPSAGRWLAAGALVGLCHLTRADGLLMWIPAFLAIGRSGRRPWSGLLWAALGYLVVMTPWLARNFAVSGSLLSPGGGRTLWLLNYDELFSYPASVLTPERWWRAGVGAILSARLDALWANLRSLILVNGLVFLGPLMAAGGWHLRHHPLVRLSTVYLLSLLAAMTVVFPFAGSHGGFFHSSTALMPVLWVLAPSGLETLVTWGGRNRGWDPSQAFRVFSVAGVAIAAALTGGLLWNRVIGDIPAEPVWEASQIDYAEVGQRLLEVDASPGVVAVNNPPGFYLSTGLQAVVIPDGSPEALRRVVERYEVGWVILDSNRPAGLAELYETPGLLPWLTPAETLSLSRGGSVVLLEVVPESQP